VSAEAAVSKLYDRIARESFPAWLDEHVFRLTEDSIYRRHAVDALGLSRGARALDAACGTGLNFKLLQSRIGASGRLVGADISAGSLAVAGRRVHKNGWQNVELLQMNLSAIDTWAQHAAPLV